MHIFIISDGIYRARVDKYTIYRFTSCYVIIQYFLLIYREVVNHDSTSMCHIGFLFTPTNGSHSVTIVAHYFMALFVRVSNVKVEISDDHVLAFDLNVTWLHKRMNICLSCQVTTFVIILKKKKKIMFRIVIFYIYIAVCNMNVHKRCQKNVANNCGIDVKQLSEILATMGIRPQDESAKRKKKVSCFLVCIINFFTCEIFFVLWQWFYYV